jgi:beta-lactam-binding protein with PASTA domain
MDGKTEVVSQNPAPGQIAGRADRVTVSIRKYRWADSRLDVPSLKGLDLAWARAKAGGSFFIEETRSERVPSVEKAGREEITSQSPEAGAKAWRGETIRVVVTRYHRPRDLVTVPDFSRARTEREVRADAAGRLNVTLRQAGVKRDNRRAGGIEVTSQSLQPGAEVDRGSPISVSYVQLLPETPPQPELVSVPNLNNDSEQAAARRLKDSGLLLGRKFYEKVPTGDRRLAGQTACFKQSVAPGTRVPRGTSVDLHFRKHELRTGK